MEDGRAALPRTIWVLGLVSLFMDISSEMIHGLLPVFLVGTLGASALTLGFIEGAAEGVASLLKLPSGWLSDRWRRRKPLTVAGYALSALVKPMFALAPTVGWVFAARFLDRLGKGVRGAPRDALVADLTPPPLRGAAFGLRQTLDTVGAFAGPLLAVALMELPGSQVRLVFWAAVLPALLSVVLLVKLVPEPAAARHRRGGVPQQAVRIAALAELGAPFWGVLAVAMVFTVGRYSEAFLVLSALGRDLPVAFAPLVLVAMNAVYAIAAYPVGRLSDRVGRWGVLALGTVAMAAADLVLALTGSLAMAIVAVMLWGLHMALSQGILAALVADTAEVRLRGTAFGLFNGLSGGALLAANAGAGFLWVRTGPSSAFLAGAAIALFTLVLIVAGCGRGRGLRLLALLPAVLIAAAAAPAAASDWDDVLARARGETVYFNAWAGDASINGYIAWAADRVQRRFAITLVHVKLRDTAEAVARVVAEAAAGRRRGGSVDLIWINGENFARLKERHLLFGPFVDRLPHFALVDTTDKPTTVRDFTIPTDGLEAPWGMAQFVMIADMARMSAPPSSMRGLLDWASEHPGRLAYPQPPDFLGTTFLKQALIELAPDASLLQRPVDERAFSAATAPLWPFLARLHPLLWRGGKEFPANGPAARQLLADGEIDLAFSFNPAEASAAIAQGLLPATVRTVAFVPGSIANTHFLAIPANASAPDAAMVVADFLLSPEAQAHKQDAAVWGDFTVLALPRLAASDRELFDKLGLGPATLPLDRLGRALLEPHPSWTLRLEQEWQRRYGG